MHGKYLAARRPRSGGCRGREFLGLDTEAMGRGAKVAAALSVIIPVALSGVFLFAFAPDLWWVITIYGWVVFPAFGLLSRGVAEVSGERELLDALRANGKLSAVGAASETSLTVAEAERMLDKLAKDGHLGIHVGGGGLFYALWEAESKAGGITGG